MRPALVWLVAVLVAAPTHSTPSASGPAPAPAVAMSGKLVLPEAMPAATLAQAVRTQPGELVVLDLRPAWQFAEWALPGARNVEVDAVADLLPTLPTAPRIVLVDRDGTLAFAVAGALLVHHPERRLVALTGGLQHYHRTIVLGGSGDAAPAMAPAGQPAKAVPPPAKKRSAGC
jgi:rhodanese-related sulfurtransferase